MMGAGDRQKDDMLNLWSIQGSNRTDACCLSLSVLNLSSRNIDREWTFMSCEFFSITFISMETVFMELDRQNTYVFTSAGWRYKEQGSHGRKSLQILFFLFLTLLLFHMIWRINAILRNWDRRGGVNRGRGEYQTSSQFKPVWFSTQMQIFTEIQLPCTWLYSKHHVWTNLFDFIQLKKRYMCRYVHERWRLVVFPPTQTVCAG